MFLKHGKNGTDKDSGAWELSDDAVINSEGNDYTEISDKGSWKIVKAIFKCQSEPLNFQPISKLFFIKNGFRYPTPPPPSDVGDNMLVNSLKVWK